MTNQQKVAAVLIVVACILIFKNLMGKDDIVATPAMPPVDLKCAFCEHTWSMSHKKWHAYFDRIRAKHAGDIPLADMNPPCPSCDKINAGVVQHGEEPVDPGYDPIEGFGG